MIQRRSIFLISLVLLGLSACSQEFEVPFFNYMDCRAKMRATYQSEGLSPTAADMKSKSYCREKFPK
jgi:hypothetical protein